MPINVRNSQFHSLNKEMDFKALNMEFTSCSVRSQIMNWISKRSNWLQLIFLRKDNERSSGTTLQEVLLSKSLTADFRDFLREEYSDENLEFWIEVENYRNLENSELEERARRMFQTYINIGAKREINIDGSLKKDIAKKMLKPEKDTFDAAQEQVFILMERDSFRRFMSKQKETKKSKTKQTLTCKQRFQCLTSKMRLREMKLGSRKIVNRHYLLT